MPIIAYNQNQSFLSYAEYGDKAGFPILIQHGLIASIKDSAIFERLMETGARLICIARPGYGESSPTILKDISEWADIVSVLIDELKLSHFDVLGMSSGAPYSYSIGYKFPDKTRNIYIFSGIPAMYADEILAHWPFEIKKNVSIAEMQKLANELFFSNLSAEDLSRNEIQDAMANNCFGIAQDFRLRCMDWGFCLADVKEPVYMRHSRSDEAVPFIAAQLTSKLLPNCRLEIKENEVHFSNETLDDYIKTTIAVHFEK
jgi:pimeloyl-ACP methyl ester carboxylesterase